MTQTKIDKSPRLKSRVPRRMPQPATAAPQGDIATKMNPSSPLPTTISAEIINIDRIRIGTRFRRELCDIRSLAHSIVEVGLRHAIVVTPRYHLIAGRRRIAAYRMLKRAHIPANVVDLDQIARGELHENAIRKDLTPSEIVAAQRFIGPGEQREARKRQGYRSDLQLPATVAGSKAISFGDARDKVAGYFGRGRTTIARTAAVVDAAERAPQEYGHLVTRMDQTGNVASAYRQLEKLRQVRNLKHHPRNCRLGGSVFLLLILHGAMSQMALHIRE